VGLLRKSVLNPKRRKLVSKKKPSIFFVTPLTSYLNDLDINTVLIMHALNLFNMQMKYADVISLNEALIYLNSLE